MITILRIFFLSYFITFKSRFYFKKSSPLPSSEAFAPKEQTPEAFAPKEQTPEAFAPKEQTPETSKTLFNVPTDPDLS